jgi:hypothetical protein
MALTEFSSVITVFTEKAFNDMITNMRRQRPSIFNFGTESFRSNFNALRYFCHDLRENIHPVFKEMAEEATTPEEWAALADMIVKKMDPVSIPGYTDNEHPYGIEWCMQVEKLEIDIHPETVHSGLLPPELNPPLKEQTLSFRIQICAGIDCPGRGVLEEFTPPYDIEKDSLTQQIIDLLPKGDKKKKDRPKDDKKDEKPDENKEDTEIVGFPFNPRNMICTCIELYALVQIERNDDQQFIGLKLAGLEIVDIPAPKGLEDIVECFLKTTITLGVFPQIRFGVDKLLMEITDYLLGSLGLGGLLEIKLTPITANVPFNPSLEKDSLKVMLTISAL